MRLLTRGKQEEIQDGITHALSCLDCLNYNVILMRKEFEDDGYLLGICDTMNSEITKTIDTLLCLATEV